jgi:hypothetical protein
MVVRAGRRPVLRSRELVIPLASALFDHLTRPMSLFLPARRGGVPHLPVPRPYASIPIASGAISPPLRAA